VPKHDSLKKDKTRYVYKKLDEKFKIFHEAHSAEIKHKDHHESLPAAEPHKKEGTHILDMFKHLSLKAHHDENPQPAAIPAKKEIKIDDKNLNTALQNLKNASDVRVQVTGLPPIMMGGAKKPEGPKVPIPLKKEDVKLIDTYNFISDQIPITIKIYDL